MGKVCLPWLFGSFVLGIFAMLSLSSYSHVNVKAAARHVVISEIQIGGGGSGNSDNDFIELYNPTDSDVNLNGFRLVKRTATGSADVSIKAWDTDTTIRSHGFYLWANSKIAASLSADASTSASIAADNGIALRQGALNEGAIIDSVAWGVASNAFVEGSPYPINPPNGTSIERKACASSTDLTMVGSDLNNGNAEDSDNNANNFVARTSPQPQNSLSDAETPGCAGSTANPSASATASPLPTGSSTPIGSSEPTDTPTPTSTQAPTSAPTATPTAAATATPIPSPTSSATATPVISPTSTGFPFPFRPLVFICRVNYEAFNMGWFIISLPQVFCGFNLI